MESSNNSITRRRNLESTIVPINNNLPIVQANIPSSGKARDTTANVYDLFSGATEALNSAVAKQREQDKMVENHYSQAGKDAEEGALRQIRQSGGPKIRPCAIAVIAIIAVTAIGAFANVSSKYFL